MLGWTLIANSSAGGLTTRWCTAISIDRCGYFFFLSNTQERATHQYIKERRVSKCHRYKGPAIHPKALYNSIGTRDQRGDFFILSLKFAPMGSRTQDLRGAAGVTNQLG